jgi:hypothetical protein
MTSALHISISLHLPVSTRWVVALTFGRGWWKVEGSCQPYLRHVCMPVQLWYPCGSRAERYRTMRSTLCFVLSFPPSEGCSARKFLGQHWGSWWGVVMGVCSGGVNDC